MGSFDVNNIFSLTAGSERFAEYCEAVFAHQFANNTVYRQWCELMRFDPSSFKTPLGIPALPIGFFKSREVVSGSFSPELLFESSGTTGMTTSRHYVKDASLYRASFLTAFNRFYGDPRNWCILGLLPSYLERKHSSLVYMVDELVRQSDHAKSGFYLNDHAALSATLQELEAAGQATLLIGVTFGLLDFAEAYPQRLQHTVVMETGGMKGRKREMTRAEVHSLLTEGLGVDTVHAEYGMTELLSQAYAQGGGRYVCPPWMKVMVRDEEDPLQVRESGRGLLQVIDLANFHSCAFIATEDVGMVHEDGSFEVWGRLDHSDMRGCSLLVM